MAIENELEKSKDYQLKFQSENILEISIDNVARIEAIIRLDSNYNRSGDINAKPEYATYQKGEKKGKKYTKYAGSTAYWMTQLNKYLLGNKGSNTLEEIIYEAVSAVDRENSTHLTADNDVSDYKDNGAGRREIANRLCGIPNLRERLYRRDFELITEIRKKTANDKGRKNYSFATKFCHYACMYLFNDEERDNFSIYDKILRDALVEYAKRYKIQKETNQNYTIEDFDNYKTYSHVIDSIREKAARMNNEEKVTRNGFDHLLWYYHKGNPIKKINQ